MGALVCRQCMPQQPERNIVFCVEVKATTKFRRNGLLDRFLDLLRYSDAKEPLERPAFVQGHRIEKLNFVALAIGKPSGIASALQSDPNFHHEISQGSAEILISVYGKEHSKLKTMLASWNKFKNVTIYSYGEVDCGIINPPVDTEDLTLILGTWKLTRWTDIQKFISHMNDSVIPMMEEAKSINGTILVQKHTGKELNVIWLSTANGFLNWINTTKDSNSEGLLAFSNSIMSKEEIVFGAMDSEALPTIDEWNRTKHVNIGLYLFGSSERRNIVLDRKSTFSDAAFWSDLVVTEDLPDLK